MRRGVVGVIAVTIVLATAWAVWGAGRGSGSVDRQSWAWTGETATTETVDWEGIPELSVRTGCQGNEKASATVSLELAEGSAPVQTRVSVSDPLCPNCEPALLNPAETTLGDGTGSFTFVGRADGSHGTLFVAEWRVDPSAPPSSAATLESGTLHVLWKKLRGTCL